MTVFSVLQRCFSVLFFEYRRKSGAVFKATHCRNLRYGRIGGIQKLCTVGNAERKQILMHGFSGDLHKQGAQVVGVVAEPCRYLGIGLAGIVGGMQIIEHVVQFGFVRISRSRAQTDSEYFRKYAVSHHLPADESFSFLLENQVKKPWVRTIVWGREWQPTPVFLPGESQEQRSLAGYSP